MDSAGLAVDGIDCRRRSWLWMSSVARSMARFESPPSHSACICQAMRRRSHLGLPLRISMPKSSWYRLRSADTGIPLNSCRPRHICFVCPPYCPSDDHRPVRNQPRVDQPTIDVPARLANGVAGDRCGGSDKRHAVRPHDVDRLGQQLKDHLVGCQGHRCWGRSCSRNGCPWAVAFRCLADCVPSEVMPAPFRDQEDSSIYAQLDGHASRLYIRSPQIGKQYRGRETPRVSMSCCCWA